MASRLFKKKKVAVGKSIAPATLYDSKPKLPSKELSRKYDALKSLKTFSPSATPDPITLGGLGILDDFRRIFDASGLSSLIANYQVQQHIPSTIEFLTTFEEREGEDGRKLWTFRLGGKRLVYKKEQVIELFGFPAEGCDPKYDRETRDEFWGRISELDIFVPEMPSKNIKDGLWKYIHRILSMTFYARVDGGRAVSKRDIDAMIAMSRGVAIDWYGILTNMFREWGNPEHKNKAIGGGFFVAMFIRDEECDISELRDLHCKIVDWKQMRCMKMLKSKTTQWNYSNEVPDRMEQAMRRRADKRARNTLEDSTDEEQEFHHPTPPRDPSPPPHPHHSSTLDERLARLEVSHEALGGEMRSFMRESRERFDASDRVMNSFMDETRESFSWIKTTLAGGFAHQGYTCFPPPPYGNPPPTNPHEAPSSSNLFTTYEELMGDLPTNEDPNQNQAPGPF